MNELTVKFTNKQLSKLIMPLVVEQFLAVAVGLADSIMVASVGEAAVSSVSLVDTINVLLINCFAALATGGAVVIGQYIGLRNTPKANDAAKQLIVFIFSISLAITALLYAFKYFILHGLFGHIDQDVMDYANTYFVIVESSIPFLALYNAGAAIFRIMGNSSISMKVSLLMNGINVAGNAILIFVFHFGVEGVAIPTLISRIIAAVVVLLLLKNDKLQIHFQKGDKYKFNWPIIKNIIRIGIPNGVENSLFQLGKVILLSVVSAFGTASIAANAIGNTVASLQIIPAMSIGIGLVTIVSQCVGAKDFDSARFYTRKLIKAAHITMLIFNVIIFALLPLIIKLYGVSAEAGHIATIILMLHGGLGIILWPESFTLPQTLKAAGDTTFTMIVAVASMWFFRIVFGILFAKYFGWGVIGIWLAMFIDWICRIIFIVTRYRGHKWEDKYVK